MASLERAGVLRPSVFLRDVSELARTPLGCRVGQFLLGAAVVRVGIALYARYRSRQRAQQLRVKWSSAGRDVVVLHQFHRGVTVPNTSPFALKLETFLRMVGATYVIDNEQPQNARTNKCPWITINGRDLTDSELIIDFLTKHFRPALHDNLTPASKALGRAVQHLLDDHAIMSVFFKTYSCDDAVNIARWVHAEYRQSYTTHWKHERKWIDEFFYAVGVGRLTETQALHFLYRDLQALDDILGDKPYLLSDAPTITDASVFAVISQALLACAPEVESYLRANHPRLVDYQRRMQHRFWPDWHRCLAKQ